VADPLIEPTLAIDDIQGNLIPGFRTDAQHVLGFAIVDADAARRFLAALAPEVTTAAAVRAQHRAQGRVVPPGEGWMNVSIAAAALRQFGIGPPFLDAFAQAGHDAATSKLLHDPTPDPATWQVNTPENPLDVSIVVSSATTEATIAQAQALIERAADGGLRLTMREPGNAITGGREHFGFPDGISQPGVLGLCPDGSPFQDRPWEVPPNEVGPPLVDRGTPLLWPGEFLFGYPRQNGGSRIGGTATWPFAGGAAAPANAWARNGSFSVFRRLRQHVEAFWKLCADVASQLQTHGVMGATDDMVAELIVGRRLDGTPLAPSGPGLNDFDYTGDAEGAACPLSAHIRKVNPRSGTSDQSPFERRILRRGVPYGASPADRTVADGIDRGLLFIAKMTSITDKFVFLQNQWMGNADAPAGDGAGQDVLVGQTSDGRRFMVLQGLADFMVTTLSRFVEPTGGQFLFEPSISALAMLGKVDLLS